MVYKKEILHNKINLPRRRTGSRSSSIKLVITRNSGWLTGSVSISSKHSSYTTTSLYNLSFSICFPSLLVAKSASPAFPCCNLFRLNLSEQFTFMAPLIWFTLYARNGLQSMMRNGVVARSSFLLKASASKGDTFVVMPDGGEWIFLSALKSFWSLGSSCLCSGLALSWDRRCSLGERMEPLRLTRWSREAMLGASLRLKGARMGPGELRLRESRSWRPPRSRRAAGTEPPLAAPPEKTQISQLIKLNKTEKNKTGGVQHNGHVIIMLVSWWQFDQNLKLVDNRRSTTTVFKVQMELIVTYGVWNNTAKEKIW